MDDSLFNTPRPDFTGIEPLNVGGATCECFKVRLYGKMHFLKQLKPELRTNPRYVAALHKEFETGYNLDHPHLARYIACGDDYLLTEYIDGMTLGDFAKTNLAFFKSKANVNRLLSALIDVLDYLHSHQIVHLDLKPDNILITRVGNELKLTDLGFCYSDTFTDTMGRTDTFAAPEQLDGDGAVDQRTDIYAVGRIIATLPCATSYRKVIERCTKASKEDRYQSVAEIKKDLSKPRAKWQLVAAIAAIICLTGLSAWWLSTKQYGKNSLEALPSDTTTLAPSPADSTAAPKTAPEATEAGQAVAPEDNGKPTAQPITIDNEPATTPNKPEKPAPAPPKQVIPDKETLRSELIAATQPIYDKYLKRYENLTTINYGDLNFRDNRHKCDGEIADKLFRLWDTKYRPMGVLESDYNPIAVEVIHYHTGKVDVKVEY